MRCTRIGGSLGSRLVVFVALAALAGACNKATTSDDDDKGGDHIPNDKIYQVASLPRGAELSGVGRIESSSPLLAGELHLSELHRICLDQTAFDAAALAGVAAQLGKGGDYDGAGLQKVVNRALTSLDQFDATHGKFSSRITLDVVFDSGERCDLLVSRAAETAFPFTHPDAAGGDRAYFEAGQLVLPDQSANTVPVAYVRSADAASEQVAIQQMAARYLGVKESSTSGSWTNPKTTASTSGKSWFVQNSDGSIRQGEDALSMYTYALTYADVLQPADLERLQHYEDELQPGAAPVDPLLAMPAAPAAVPFVEVVGNESVRGVRKTGATQELKACFDDPAGAGVEASTVQAFLDVSAATAAEGLIHQINLSEATWKPTLKVAASGCALLVSFRNEQQYPFNEVSANGLYAHEGDVADQAGAPATVPVIYLDVDALEMDPAVGTVSAKGDYAGLVLEHELGHFFGLKHSAVDNSPLSPAASKPTWPAADRAMFDELARRWRAAP